MTADIADIWRRILESLASDDRVQPSLHGFLGLASPKGVMAGTIFLEVPNDLTRTMIEQRGRLPLLGAIAQLDDDAKVSTFAVIVNPDVDPTFGTAEPADETAPDDYVELPPQRPSQQRDYANSREPVAEEFDTAATRSSSTSDAEQARNAKYTFDNFVIGGSNRFAHAAAVAVAEAPARSYNPLFIYGESGLGKTHLLHAIGHYAESMYPGIRVRYVSSEEFTNDFINSIANNRTQSFHARYRHNDILLIDDIQFLQGKDTTQEAFFHTFNTLHEHNKQVVITSDLPPKRLTGFEDRMRSRFEWGLITDVQSPDLETRIAILRKKAQIEKMQIPDDALEFIASRITSSIRELEGTLIRVTAYASLNGQHVDMPLVMTVLKDLVSDDEPSYIAPTDIIRHTADYFHLSVDDLYGSSRSQAIATSRQIAMYLCREMTSMSLPKIGQLFGGRDHTTVMYAHRKITKLITERRDVYNQVAELTSRIRQNGAGAR
ncbi:chromosomal replication initiator protein DnaA [Pseudoclavibacter chungangensis]|uniref:Chromosomal replication initiator protein DnaA n=1 Tax=Pseudoclavibacter chungangensis TaxID=587635 RepID=A0A7J5BRZ6_9MICO|nr:chromosomal replication initiator protein DnaA [Pseudoclavibacter chungangensis]KAB1655383.1 chromosomal replication initiator protein DnaA [Pseudoclavibacter chungangensis]NYJ68335.1 chromosomal replication initiator protein [Pseudoclavibacter chungangensis]